MQYVVEAGLLTLKCMDFAFTSNLFEVIKKFIRRTATYAATLCPILFRNAKWLLVCRYKYFADNGHVAVSLNAQC